MLFFTHSKASVPCLWVDISCRHLSGSGYLAVGQVTQLTQSLDAFCTLLQYEVHQSHKHLSSPSLWNTLIMVGFTQFLLKYPSGIFVLGQATLLIRDSRIEQGCVGGMG